MNTQDSAPIIVNDADKPAPPVAWASMRFGQHVLDTRRHVLHAPDGDVQLSPLAGRLLELLARAPGETVERSAIIEELWRGDWLTGDPALNRVVSELRRSVGDDPRSPMLIQTVPRRGYRLLPPAGDLPEQIGALPTPSAAEEPMWRQIWRMGNITMAILFTGLSAILLLAIFAHN